MLQQYLGKFWGLNETGVLKNKETAKTQKKKIATMISPTESSKSY